MPPRPPAPPSFYSNVAQMGGGGPSPGGGPEGGPGGPTKPGANKEDEVKGIQLMLQLWEKLREGAEGNPEKLGHIQKIVDMVKQYDEKFVKSGAGGEGKPPAPAAAEGQGPAPGAAPPGGPGGPPGAQPVPA